VEVNTKIDWPEEPEWDEAVLRENLADYSNYIMEIVDIVASLDDPVAKVWTREHVTDQPVFLTLRNWLRHGALATFGTIVNSLPGFSNGPEKDAIVEVLIKSFPEYRLKVSAVSMLLNDTWTNPRFIDNLTDVVWTKENPAPSEIGPLYLFRELLRNNRDKKIEVFKEAKRRLDKTLGVMVDNIGPKGVGEKKNKNDGSFEVDETGKKMAVKPLQHIPEDDVKQILIMSDVLLKATKKIGESVIDLWALVTSVHKKYPEAVIYVGTTFPGIFRADQFDGKVVPMPTREYDIEDFGYEEDEWRDFTIDKMIWTSDIPSYRYRLEDSEKVRNDMSQRRLRFLAEKEIDLVFDMGVMPAYYRDVHKRMAKAYPGKPSPHVFSIRSAIGATHAFSPDVWGNFQGPDYEDREGNVYGVAGIEDLKETIMPGNVLGKAGIWETNMCVLRMMGLDVDNKNLTQIKLSVEESVGALMILKEWFYSMNSGASPEDFDPTKKIIVVNVYAVTHWQDILTSDMWSELIDYLVENIDNAYFIFTSGGEMDGDTYYIDTIVNKLRAHGSDILIPRVNIYPYINDILGISSGLVTLDTGLSHIGNGVYGVPTAVITKPNILHWLTPRDNAYPVMADDVNTANVMATLGGGIRDLLDQEQIDELSGQVVKPYIESLRPYVEYINNTAERPAAVAAKAAAASVEERARMDSELLANRKDFIDAEFDIKIFLYNVINRLGIREHLELLGVPVSEVIPKIDFVDSAAQAGVRQPRFITKLYTPEPGEVHLLVDTSALERVVANNGSETMKVKENIKKIEVLHEVVGHIFACYVFTGFKEAHLRTDGNVEKELPPEIKAKEEILARLMTFLVLYRLNKNHPRMVGQDLRNYLWHKGIDLTVPEFGIYVNVILESMLRVEDVTDISGYRYNKIIRSDSSILNAINKDIRERYLPELEILFGLAEEKDPSWSLLANIFTEDHVWINRVLRVFAVGSTPFHELGHIVWGRLSGQRETSRSFFKGEVYGLRGSPAKWGGIVGNLIASGISFGSMTTLSAYGYAGMFLYISLLYLGTINMISVEAELAGRSFGKGDLSYNSRIDLSSILTEDLKNAFRDIDGGKEPYAVHVSGNDPAAFRKLYDGLKNAPKGRFGMFTLSKTGWDGIDHFIVVDKPEEIPGDTILKKTENIWMDNIPTNRSEFILHFKVYPKEKAIHIYNLSMGRHYGERLRGKGLMGGVFERFAEELEEKYPSMNISAVAIEERHEDGSFKVVPHLMKKYFNATLDESEDLYKAYDRKDLIQPEYRNCVYQGVVGERGSSDEAGDPLDFFESNMMMTPQALAANIFTERFSGLKNLPLRILGLLTLATPAHEWGHIRASLKNGGKLKERGWDLFRGIFVGEVTVQRGPPEVYFAGASMNILLGLTAGLFSIVSTLFSFKTPAFVLSVISVVNLIFAFGEVFGGRFGRGDLVCEVRWRKYQNVSEEELSQLRAEEETVLQKGGGEYEVVGGYKHDSYGLLKHLLEKGFLAKKISDEVYSPVVDNGDAIKFAGMAAKEAKRVVEELVENGQRRMRILDFGTGTGITSMAVVNHAKKYAEELGVELEVEVDAIDISQDACDNVLFNYNEVFPHLIGEKDRLSVRKVEKGDEFRDLEGSYDLILFNAPDSIDGESNSPSVMINVDELRTLLEKLADRLSPDGVFLLQSRVEVARHIVPRILFWDWTLFGDVDFKEVRDTFTGTHYGKRSGIADDPANATATNFFNGKYSRQLNRPSRLWGLATLATFAHEMGHVILSSFSRKSRETMIKAYREAAVDKIAWEIDKSNKGRTGYRKDEKLKDTIRKHDSFRPILRSKARGIFLRDIFYSGRARGVHGVVLGWGGIAGNIAGIVCGVAAFFLFDGLLLGSGLSLDTQLKILLIVGLPVLSNIFYVGLEVMLSPLARSDLSRYLKEIRKKKSENLMERLEETGDQRHQIGHEMGRFGHAINGGKSTGRSGDDKREKIIVDFSEDRVLRKFYRGFMIRFYIRLWREIGIAAMARVILSRMWGDRSEVQLPGAVKGRLVRIVYDTVESMVEYDLDYVDGELKDKYKGKWVLIGDAAIAPGRGVCRHHGIIVTSVLERLIAGGYLHGRTFYRRFMGHGWAEYRDSGGNYHRLDVAQKSFETNCRTEPLEEEERDMTMEYAFERTMFLPVRDVVWNTAVPVKEPKIKEPKIMSVWMRLALWVTAYIFGEHPSGMNAVDLKGERTGPQHFSGEISVGAGTRSYSFRVEGDEVRMKAVD
ncbi:MAG: hypothetical protein P9L88_02035, partial [Candidatus Tantalella remota]|nr:hypothetical protein [Candidatus Tantalella remota]